MKTRAPSDIRLGHTNGVMELVFRPGGAELISSGFEETFIVWSLHPREVQMIAGHSGSVTDVAVSPDETMLASASADSTIKLWDLASGRERALLAGHRGEVRAIAFNPGSGILASGGEDRTIRFWDTASGGVTQRIDAQGEVESLAISPDGTTLAWASGGNAPIFLWDIGSQKERGELRGHDTNARSLEFSRKGDLLVSAGGSTIRVWDPRSARELVEPMEVFTALKATISPDGLTIASTQTDPGTILLWSVRRKEKPVELPTQYDGKHSLAFSPNGGILAYSDDEADLSVVLRLLGKGNTNWTFEMPASVQTITFTRDGKRLVTGHSNGQIGLWDVDVERWPERACEIANRNLTHEEWKELVGEALPYRAVCPDRPVPKE
jgi:WD40 repeat protein